MMVKEPKGKIVFLFDVDGVLTDKRKVNPEVLTEIARLLEYNPTVLITGRSVAWLSERVLPKLENQVSVPNVLSNLLVLAEIGSVLIEYRNAKRKITMDRRVKIPKVLIQKTKELAHKEEFSEYLFFDNTKKTMISVEMQEEGEFEDQKRVLARMTSLLKKIIIEQKLENRFEIIETAIATNIQSKTVCKGSAARRAWELLRRRDISCSNIFIFGDSREDLRMGEELKRIGAPFSFVYVGPERLRRVGFTVTRTLELYDRGTLSFLRGLHAE
jgi:HAD superfamily hydrolase (TIGR01484 family)